MEAAGGPTSGFDYLRIIFAVVVLVLHSIPNAEGPELAHRILWTGPFRFLSSGILPVFFALSGFLVAGSLERTQLPQFITLRAIRIVPPLAVQITFCALVIGTVFTTLPLGEYLSHKEFYTYFLNIIGLMQFQLPGVFDDNPTPRLVNLQLWTLPYELSSYALLILLSVARLLRRRGAFLVLFLAVTGLTAGISWVYRPLDMMDPMPGRVLVLCFLAGVALYLFRDVVLYSAGWAGAAALTAAVLLQIPNACYFTPLPIAYLTIWLGLTRPPAVPFGDLSYSMYLFHFPAQQAIVQMLPDVRSWWALTLISLPVTIAGAWLSWKLVEQPVLKHRKPILRAVDRFRAALPKSARQAP